MSETSTPEHCVFDAETVKALRATTKLGLSGMLASAQAANVGLCVHPKEPLLLSGFYGKESRLDTWDLDQKFHTGSLKIQSENDENTSLRDVALSPSGDRIALAINNEVQIIAWESGSLRHLQTLPCEHTKTQTVAFSPNGTLLVSGDSEGFAIIWHTDSWEEATQLREPTASFDAAAFSYDGHLLAMGDQHGNVIVWDLTTGNKRAHFQGHSGKVSALMFAPDTYTLATGGFDGKISLWDMAKRRPIGSPQSHQKAVYNLYFDAKGNYLFSSSLDCHIGVWNAQDLSLIDCFVDENPVLSMAIQADGSQLAVATQSALKTLFNRRKPPKETLLASAKSLAPGSTESILVSTLSSSYIQARQSSNSLSAVQEPTPPPRAQVSGSLPRPDFSNSNTTTGSKTSMVLERPSFPSKQPSPPPQSADPRARIQHSSRASQPSRAIPTSKPAQQTKPRPPRAASPWPSTRTNPNPRPNAGPKPKPRPKRKPTPAQPQPPEEDFTPSFVNPNAQALFSAALDSMESDTQSALGASDEQHKALQSNPDQPPKTIDIDENFDADPLTPNNADEDPKPKKPVSTLDRKALERAEAISKRSSDFYTKGFIAAVLVGIISGPIGLLFRPSPEKHKDYPDRLAAIEKSITELKETEKEEFTENEERLDRILLDTRLASEEPDKDPKVAEADRALRGERTRHKGAMEDLEKRRQSSIVDLKEELQAGYIKYILGGLVVGFALGLAVIAALLKFVIKPDDEKYNAETPDEDPKSST